MEASSPLDEMLRASYKHGASTLDTHGLTSQRRTFLFGYPISHSLAPTLHTALFNGISTPWTYKLHETQDASEFVGALKQADVIGCAVTMPYKVAMMSVVDELTEEAKGLGAINTVFLRRGEDGRTKYIGTNTDTIGLREAFLQNVPGCKSLAAGKPALVIGGGGACRASIYALRKYLGVSRVYLANRLESEITAIMDSFKTLPGFEGDALVHVSSVSQAAALETPFLVVGTVPDLPPREPGEVLAREITMEFLNRSDKGHVLEMCYHPKPTTAFHELGTRCGWNMIFGTEVMIWQGIAQQILWTELPLSKFKVEEAQEVIQRCLTTSHESRL